MHKSKLTTVTYIKNSLYLDVYILKVREYYRKNISRI